eukprot:353996-Chlamydomonas_euryale.AAC.5
MLDSGVWERVTLQCNSENSIHMRWEDAGARYAGKSRHADPATLQLKSASGRTKEGIVHNMHS